MSAMMRKYSIRCWNVNAFLLWGFRRSVNLQLELNLPLWDGLPAENEAQAHGRGNRNEQCCAIDLAGAPSLM